MQMKNMSIVPCIHTNEKHKYSAMHNEKKHEYSALYTYLLQMKNMSTVVP